MNRAANKATEIRSPKQITLDADRRYMSMLIRRAVGRCECCGRTKRFQHRPCEVCVPSL